MQTFLVDMVSTVIASLAHNWLPLSLAVAVSAIMRVYVNGEKLKRMLLGRPHVSILASVALGALTPLCACGTTAVVIGMLTTTLPWGPIMAFLTSSPLMSPEGFILDAGILGLRFAIALTTSSIVIGLASGYSAEASTKKFQRQYVNIFDCENSLEEEVKWLRKKFPDTRFTLKEFMST